MNGVCNLNYIGQTNLISAKLIWKLIDLKGLFKFKAKDKSFSLHFIIYFYFLPFVVYKSFIYIIFHSIRITCLNAVFSIKNN